MEKKINAEDYMHPKALMDFKTCKYLQVNQIYM